MQLKLFVIDNMHCNMLLCAVSLRVLYDKYALQNTEEGEYGILSQLNKY